MIRILLALFFALCVAIFAVINVNQASVHYIFGVTELPLVLIILGSACFGGLIVALLGAVSVFRLRRERKRLRLSVADLESRMPKEDDVQDEHPQTFVEEPASTPAPVTNEDAEESRETVADSSASTEEPPQTTEESQTEESQSEQHRY